VHGRGDLAAAATGFGLRGASVTQPGQYARLFQEHQGSRAYRRAHYGEA
jgi:acetolactate synthase-1/2/3 large subunit